MFNELIEQIGGRARLEKIASWSEQSWSEQFGRGSNIVLPVSEAEAMARALLAVLDANQVHQFISNDPLYDGYVEWIDCNEEYFKGVRSHEGRTLYTAPPSATVSDVNFDLSKPGTEATVITHYQVPDGWKLVPLKAFPSQWAAGQKAFDSAGINKIDPVYHAMVEAAPAPGGTI